jgi:hypothetical protein
MAKAEAEYVNFKEKNEINRTVVEAMEKENSSINLEDNVASSSNIPEMIQVQVTGLPEIRGDNFYESANSLCNEMDS